MIILLNLILESDSIEAISTTKPRNPTTAMSAPHAPGSAEYNDAYAAHIEAANSLQRSHVRLIGTNDKINDLAAALKAAKEDKVRLLREVERKRKAAGDATVAFYATVAKSTRYDRENPLPSPVYHATSPPPSPQSPPPPHWPLAGDASRSPTLRGIFTGVGCFALVQPLLSR
jgi:hypothetical protein